MNHSHNLNHKVYFFISSKTSCAFLFIFQNYNVQVINQCQWRFRMKGTSRKTFRIIVSTKCIFLNFDFGGGGAQPPPLECAPVTSYFCLGKFNLVLPRTPTSCNSVCTCLPCVSYAPPISPQYPMNSTITRLLIL
jgi:hypothetical protein